MYSKAGSLVLGFHGCDESIRDLVVSGKENLKKSQNDYDWLGHGFYFWENNPERANNWATQLTKKPKSKIKKPAVLGAIIDLGYCLDFLNNRNITLLTEAYKNLSEINTQLNLPIPINKTYGDSIDLVQRFLDCSVIESIHQMNKELGKDDFDSVRGVFFEGEEVYPSAGFKTGNHIQICVRNPNCIKAYFLPREREMTFNIP